MILVDSNVLVAVFDDRDALAGQARPLWEGLCRSGANLIFLDCVVDETVSVLCRRFEQRKRLSEWPDAYQKMRNFFTRDRISWSYPEVERLYDEILDLVAQHGGRLNFHDALISLVARDQGIGQIVSFDSDFDQIAWLTRVGNAGSGEIKL
jgi:predicted nucleic acid-binding protein